MNTFKNFIEKLNSYSYPYRTFGIFGFITYPTYYMIWHFAIRAGYESLSMRLIASFICVPLIFAKNWPFQFKKYLGLYWHITILYSLPFYFTYILLMNNFSYSSVLNTFTVILLTILLLETWTMIITLFLGIMLGWLLFTILNSNYHYPTVDYLTIGITYSTAIIFGTIFTYKKTDLINEKITAMFLVASTIAHELRTPLATVKLCASGVRAYMTSLIESYQIARTHNLPVPVIENEILNSIPDNLDSINLEADSAFVFIDMLLMNVNQQEFSQNLTPCSMRHCIQSALGRYPFKGDEKSKIHLELSAEDFNFLGSEMLMIHVLFNLIKNALYYIAAKPTSGDITVTTKVGTPNKLYFKDTGTGIAKDTLPHIFDRFFSRTRHGTGIGLAFCKMVIEAFGGKIYCHSEEGEYTEFLIELPPIK